MKDKTPKEFFTRLAALLDEFDVEIEVDKTSDHYYTQVTGIEFGFRGHWDTNGDPVRPAEYILLPQIIDSDDCKKEANR